jgi:hypothetical protein
MVCHSSLAAVSTPELIHIQLSLNCSRSKTLEHKEFQIQVAINLRPTAVALFAGVPDRRRSLASAENSMC